jgi:mRNA interferase MazF
MVEINRGDIVIVNLEPVKGSEQGGIRPCLVIQNDLGNKFSPLTIVAPFTSRKMNKDYPTNVRVLKSESRLDKDSTILLNQINSIDKLRITKKISSLNDEIMDKVDMAIKISLGLN